ncbi:MAG: response regulator [Firmicutes bacterium]|nr:response regulator [Bacillota bacterium]
MLISSLYFQFLSCFYIVLLTIIYFCKRRVNNKETKIYSYLIISSIIGLILDFITTYLAYIDVTNIFLNPLCKLYLLYIVMWCYLLGIYIFYISSPGKILKKIMFLYNILTIIFSIIIMIIPLYNFSENGVIYTYGPGANTTYIIVGIDLFIYLLLFIFNFKKINIKKYYPVFAFMVLLIMSAIIQNLNPQILLVTSCGIFVTFLMYFTIENPDVKMIEQLNIAKDQADKANKAKSDFLSSMSHEIRTPLNAIVGFSECILQEHEIEDIHRDANDVIMAAQNLLEIVNGVLDISKIEANKMEIVETDYELLPAIENIAKLMIPRIGEKPIELKTNFAVDIPYKMHGDIGKIKQIITNILTNAAKYTEKGEINFEVNCINENNISSLVISVEDSGRGISPDKIDKLFTKFNRLDEDRNTTIEGTGLGLAITKSLVDMLGGKIVVQSKYGEGSKFTVYIKQNIVKLHKDETDEVKEENKNDKLMFTNAKILVVDDNKLNLRVADKIIKGYGISTTLIDNGQECINMIKNKENFDIIFMDDMMPRMTGPETLQRLKQIEGFDIPVVALTANALSGEKEKYLNLGFNEYLAKPIEKLELERILLTFLKTNSNEKNLENNKVLIVDDNKINIKVAESFLKPYNFSIDTALSGSECIDLVKDKDYNLIFMDDMMPNLSGVETLHKLKENNEFKTPVVALTANAINGAREHYLNEGFDDYIAKPIDKSTLNDIINKVLAENNLINETIEEKEEAIENNIEDTTNSEENKKGNVEYLKNNDFDIDSALELLGDIEMYNESMEEFKNDISNKIIKLKRFKDANDLENYAILVHGLKSECRYLGITKLADMAYEHELKSKAKDQAFVDENFDTLINECARIKLIVDEY